MSKLRPCVAALTLFVLASGCGGSDRPTAAGSPAAPSSAAAPAHDLRITAELERLVTDEWNANFSDPAGANYEAGATVKSVHCVPQAGTTRSTCVITPTKGKVRTFDYLVAEDGTSAERALAQG